MISFKMDKQGEMLNKRHGVGMKKEETLLTERLVKKNKLVS